MRNDNESLALKAKINALLAPFQKRGQTRRALCALAEILQSDLTIHPSHRNGEVIPYEDDLEMIMRAVIAVLDGMEGAADPGSYISAKLRSGVRGLAYGLEKDMPSFREAENRHEKDAGGRLTSLT